MEPASGKEIIVSLTCPVIEIFLSPYGAGILSVTLALSPAPGKAWLTAPEISRFNYLGAQLRDNTMPRLHLPHPQHRQAPQEPGSAMSPPPATDAPLGDRLGAWGGSFRMKELRDFLLQPIWQPDPSADIQGQFSVYTVVLFDAATDLASRRVRRDLAPFLAGLAQVEEPLHASAVPESLGIQNHLFNAKHWAAVSFLGAAHLIADQGNQGPGGSPVAYDAQRLQSVRDKYFVPYLAAFLQRLTIHHILKEARHLIVAFPGTGSHWQQSEGGLSELRYKLLEFETLGNFTEISSREALNRFYDLARQALRVADSFGAVRRTISEVHDEVEAKRAGENLQTVATVQSKLEWLEVFFVSFYTAELAEVISESAHFDETYRALSVTGWALAAALVAAVSLRPWDHGHGKRKQPRRLVLGMTMAAILAFILWVASGHMWMRQSNPEFVGHIRWKDGTSGEIWLEEREPERRQGPATRPEAGGSPPQPLAHPE